MAVLVRRKLEAVVPRSVHEVASEEAEDQVSWSARGCPGRGRTSRPHGSRCIAGRNQRGQFRSSIDGGSGGGSYFRARHRSVLLRCYFFVCAWLETGHGDMQSYGTGLDFNDVDAVVAGVAWNRDAVPSLRPLQRASARPGHHQLLVTVTDLGASDDEGFRGEGLTLADAPVPVRSSGSRWMLAVAAAVGGLTSPVPRPPPTSMPSNREAGWKPEFMAQLPSSPTGRTARWPGWDLSFAEAESPAPWRAVFRCIAGSLQHLVQEIASADYVQ